MDEKTAKKYEAACDRARNAVREHLDGCGINISNSLIEVKIINNGETFVQSEMVETRHIP